jgi:Flp pilus assembly protein TadD
VAGVALALALAACGGSAAAPETPSEGTRAAIAKADAAMRRRAYLEARAGYEAAVRDAPDRPSAGLALRELADALLLMGEHAAAAAALEELTRRAPSAAAWHDLGIVRAHLGDAVAAERALRRAGELAPGDPRPRIAIAALFVRGERWDAALREYRALQGMELPPKTAKAVARAIEMIEAERRRP